MSFSDLNSLITTIAVVLAGIWTLYRFGITRERYPKLQFDLKMNYLGKSRDRHIVEFIAEITNKGLTRQYIHDFKFNILSFDDSMPLEKGGKKELHQLMFKEYIKDTDWQNPDHDPFVDGGITRQFTHVTDIDADILFVMVYSKFYEKSSLMKGQEKYNIAKTFALKEAKS